MKIIFLSMLCFAMAFQVDAAKRNRSNKQVTCSHATYSLIDNEIRKVGRVYEFTIQTKTNDVLVDSVWFGATPVPCDLMEIQTGHRIQKADTKGTYLVKANQDLYANFVKEADSTEAYKLFKAPIRFSGDAIIFYKVHDKRMYLVVNHVDRINPKPTR
jgi:hypothetical protein